MSGLSVSGIASGIDSDSIISQMVALETRSIANFQRRIAIEEAERLTFQDISSRLQELKTATNAFASDSLFSTLSATSSDTDLLTVSATSDAPRGIHNIKVLQTARAHRIGGTGVEDPTATPLAAGFSKTSYNNDLLGTLNAADFSLSVDDASTYDYDNQVTIDGDYTGTDNVDISIEVLDDYVAGSGSINLRISTDGGQTSTIFNNVNAAGDTVTLTSAAHFGGLGFDVTLDNLEVGQLKDNDEFSFRARGTASIEYTIGDGSRQEVLVESDVTLAELVRQINDDSDLGLRADILNDGSATNPYRLILTSLEEGRSGEIDLLHNATIIGLDGVSAEDPVADTQTYTGEIALAGTYAGGLDNSNIVIEMMEAGAADGTAKFRISIDGGLNFHDDDGAGFDLTATVDLNALTKNDGGGNLFSTDPGIDLTFTNSGAFSVGDRVTLDLFDSEIQSAQDALININGINLVKSSNVVDDVFTGLTLNLQDADPDKTISVNISEKAGDITSALTSFVTSYNSAISLLNAQSKFDPEEDDSAPLLMGDATVRQIQSSLQRYVTGRISILGSDTISSLTDLGITTDSKTGQLNFDTATLSTALSDDPTAVRRLLSRFGDLVSGNDASFVSSTSATKAGLYEIEVTQARTRAELEGVIDISEITVAEDLTIRVDKDAQGTGNVASLVVNLGVGLTPAQQMEKIQDALNVKEVDVTVAIENDRLVLRHNQYGDDFEIQITSSLANGESGFTNVVANHTSEGTDLKGKINGITVTASEDQLVGSDGFAFEDLRIQVSNDFLGDAGTIRLNDGLGSSFTKLLDSFVSFDGVINTRINSFDSTISRIESQVTRVTERANLLETRLRKQFVNLEVTLGKLNATGSFLTEQLKTLPGVQINKK